MAQYEEMRSRWHGIYDLETHGGTFIAYYHNKEIIARNANSWASLDEKLTSLRAGGLDAKKA